MTYDYNEELDSLGMLEAMNIASINSIAYRGYFYDFETGLYYLQSRYYDPEIGRFINADDTAYIGYDSSPISTNIFAYCANNPVNYSDIYGYSGKYILGEELPDATIVRRNDDYVYLNKKPSLYYKALKRTAYIGASVVSVKYPNGVKFYKHCLNGEGQILTYKYSEAFNQDTKIRKTIIAHFFELKKYVIKYYKTKTNYTVHRSSYFNVECSSGDWKLALNSHQANFAAYIIYNHSTKEYFADRYIFTGC